MSHVLIEKAKLKIALAALEHHTQQTRPIHQTNEAICMLNATLAEPAVEPVRPDVLEKLSYHYHERDDLTLDDCLTYLQTNGWHKVRGRTERSMLLQLTALMAASPPPPAEVPLPSQITEEMHQAACKVLIRANGLDGTPQRMLDAIRAASPPAEVPLLTDDEIHNADQTPHSMFDSQRIEFARAIEQAVRQKAGL